MTRTHRTQVRRPGLRALAVAPVLVAVAVFGGSAAYAAWNASVAATGSVTAGQLSVSVSDTLNAVVHNSDFRPTLPLTVTNTTAGSSTQVATVQTTVVGSDDGTMSGGVGWVWPVSDLRSCEGSPSPGTGIVQGGTTTLGTLTRGLVTTSSLAPGQSASYCVQIMLSPSFDAVTGTRAMTTTATSTISVGEFQAAAQRTGQWSTKAIYPYTIPANAWYRVMPTSHNNVCLDVTGGQNAAPGAVLGTYACHPTVTEAYANQWFSIKGLSDSNGRYASIESKLPANRYLQTGGSGVTVANASTTLRGQRWLPQLTGPNTYQLVSLESGLCMTAPVTSGPVTMTVCDDLPSQKFLFDRLNVAVPATFAGDMLDGFAPVDDQLETTQGDDQPDEAQGTAAPVDELLVDDLPDDVLPGDGLLDGGLPSSDLDTSAAAAESVEQEDGPAHLVGQPAASTEVALRAGLLLLGPALRGEHG